MRGVRAQAILRGLPGTDAVRSVKGVDPRGASGFRPLPACPAGARVVEGRASAASHNLFTGETSSPESALVP